MSRGDIADRASDREAEIVAEALARQRLAAETQAKRDRALGDAPTRCVECATKIPVGRMRAVPGCKRCTECQQFLDQLRKRK